MLSDHTGRWQRFLDGCRLAASSADGSVRLYAADGRRLAQRTPVQGARPYGIAFSPEGSLLVLGFEAGQLLRKLP